MHENVQYAGATQHHGGFAFDTPSPVPTWITFPNRQKNVIKSCTIKHILPKTPLKVLCRKNQI